MMEIEGRLMPVPRAGGLVPCKKEECPEWGRYDHDCIHLTRQKDRGRR